MSISDELLAAAKRRARERGLTLGDVVDAALRRELSVPTRQANGLPYRSSTAEPDPGRVWT